MKRLKRILRRNIVLRRERRHPLPKQGLDAVSLEMDQEEIALAGMNISTGAFKTDSNRHDALVRLRHLDV